MDRFHTNRTEPTGKIQTGVFIKWTILFHRIGSTGDPPQPTVDNIRKYFARSPPLSAQDVDGWRPREHVAFLFSEDDEEFHNLIRKHMVMPFVLGDVYPGHSEEVAGGKYFALVKPNADGAPLVKPNADGAPLPNAGGASADADVRGIVIGSTWRRCSASHAVAESSLAVADCLFGQYDNFLQFAGQKHGATRCAQIVQLLLANHVNHDDDDCFYYCKK